jgi:predicted TIM-barrel fold metal-dependent hydrolase
MLVVRAVEDIPEQGIAKGDEFHLYIVDTHHHMGREKGHRNTPTGAYDFYTQLWFEVQNKSTKMMANDNLLFEPVGVVAPKIHARLFDSRESWKRANHGWLVDRTVVFPYTDDYSQPDKPGTPSFAVSNNKIAGWTSRAPHSSRLIGFARVNPRDGEEPNAALAVSEVERAILRLGLRGLKLHPLAQLFMDEIDGATTKNVVKRAAELDVPIIFDTRNIKTVERIQALVDSIRNDPSCGAATRNLRVIIAHCGMSPSDPKLFEALRDPAMWAETSTLHDLDVPALFETAHERMGLERGRWSDKIMFGTDYSFLTVQAADVIVYLLSRDFQGTLVDAQKILGGNALHLIQRPFRTELSANLPPLEVFTHDKEHGVQHTLESFLLQKISESDWDLASLDFMMPPESTWPRVESTKVGGFNGVYQNSYLLSLRSNSVDGEIHVWVRRRAGGLLSVSILGAQGPVRIETLEHASQKTGGVLSQALSDGSRLARSAKELLEAIETAVT